MLCSKADIQRRISLGYAAFNKYRKAWNNKISLKKRLLLYEALVVSVLMYNSSWWAAPKASLDKLDVVHRRHLRTILNYKYPSVISNVNLYIRCDSEPLSAKVERSRWKMLGHGLRGPVEGPAYTSLVFTIKSLSMKGRIGRPQSNLFSLIKHDLNERNLFLNNINDLYYLRKSIVEKDAMFDLISVFFWERLDDSVAFCYLLFRTLIFISVQRTGFQLVL